MLRTKITVLALGSLLVPVLAFLLLNASLLARSDAEAVKRGLAARAEDIAGQPATQQRLRGFTYSGLQTMIQGLVESADDLTCIAVFDTREALFAYPHALDLARLTDVQRRFVLAGGGETFVDVLADSPGTLVRAFAPVLDNGVRVGTVMAETTLSLALGRRRSVIVTAALCLLPGLVLALLGSAWLSGRFRRTLLGMKPAEIAAAYTNHAGIIEALREGVIAVDRHGMIAMANTSAARLLGMGDRQLNGRYIRDIMPGSRLPDVMASGKPEFNWEQQVRGRVIITTRIPIREGGGPAGAVEIFQDKSHIVELAEELTGARQLVDTLRATSHEFQNKLHVIMGLLERGHVERAQQYIMDTQLEHGEFNRVLGRAFRDPVVSGLILGKCVACREQGVKLTIDPASTLDQIDSRDLSHALLTVIGNLVNNAMDSARTVDDDDSGRIVLAVVETPGEVVVDVVDNGPGIAPEVRDRLFVRGSSTKGEGHGIGLFLVRQTVDSADGSIDVSSAPGQTRFTVRLPK